MVPDRHNEVHECDYSDMFIRLVGFVTKSDPAIIDAFVFTENARFSAEYVKTMERENLG